MDRNKDKKIEKRKSSYRQEMRDTLVYFVDSKTSSNFVLSRIPSAIGHELSSCYGIQYKSYGIKIYCIKYTVYGIILFDVQLCYLILCAQIKYSVIPLTNILCSVVLYHVLLLEMTGRVKSHFNTHGKHNVILYHKILHLTISYYIMVYHNMSHDIISYHIICYNII